MSDYLMSCHNCERLESNLRRCSGCKSVYYCSMACQTIDWAKHKELCVKIKHQPDVSESSLVENEAIRASRRQVKSTPIGKRKKKRGDKKKLQTGVDETYTANVVEEEKGQCICCAKEEGLKKCSRCKDVMYCSRACQKQDWGNHKHECEKKVNEEDERILRFWKKKEDFLIKCKEMEENAKIRNEIVIENFGGSSQRMFQTLTKEKALQRATRPVGSLQKALVLAKLYFPRYDIRTYFDQIPLESPSHRGSNRNVYVLVAFMYRYHEHAMRHGVYLKDAKDIESKVEFYLDHVRDNPFPFFSYSEVKPGNYICLEDPVIHQFKDGTVGIRIGNPEQVRCLDINKVMEC